MRCLAHRDKTGSIHTAGDGRTSVPHVQCRSARRWSAVRARLAAFATITQDGDDEAWPGWTICRRLSRPR
jgi:hypothetical protein